MVVVWHLVEQVFNPAQLKHLVGLTITSWKLCLSLVYATPGNAGPNYAGKSNISRNL